MSRSPQPISRVLLAETWGSYYYEDVSALQQQPVTEAERWFTPGVTPGFDRVRDVAEVLSLGLASGQRVVWGDCVGVSYGGKAGREGLLRHRVHGPELRRELIPWLERCTLTSLRGFARDFRAFEAERGQAFHPGIAYGVSQAVLAHLAPEGEMFRLVADEWGLPQRHLEPLPLQGSSGNNRYDAVDKMLARRLAALPHSQVDDIGGQVGWKGEVLLDYGRWLGGRIGRFAHADYRPTIHLDVHGALGVVFGQDVVRVGEFLLDLEEVLDPFPLRLESAMLASSREAQLDIYARLKGFLAERGSRVEIVADEWANRREDIERFAAAGCVHMVHIKAPDVGSLVDIIEATLACQRQGVKVLLGGSCVETDLSTRAMMHVAMVLRPEVVLMKPGMGIDEAYMMCQGEMARIAALSRAFGEG